MNNIMKTCAILLLPALLFGCGGGAGQPMAGSAVVVIAEEGVNTNKDSNKDVMKTGEACSINILNLVATGDASISKAAYNGAIKNVTSVDRKIKGLNWYWVGIGYSCTVVRGY